MSGNPVGSNDLPFLTLHTEYVYVSLSNFKVFKDSEMPINYMKI